MTVTDLPDLDATGPAALRLLGRGATEVLDAVFGPLGATVTATEPRGTTYHPGRSLTVRHDATIRWPDGRETTEQVVVSSGRRAPEGATVVSDGKDEVVVWRTADDPWLPGLARALDAAAMQPLLARLGFDDAAVQCRLRAYRPARRAVVEVVGANGRAFVKVVRPRDVEALHRRHEALAPVVPVPASLGWSSDLGIVVLQALPGRTLRDAMRGPSAKVADLPSPVRLLDLLDALPATTTESRAGSWRRDEFASHLAMIAPELSVAVSRIADRLAPFEDVASLEPIVPVHGDFYEAQLLVERGRVVGLLDVDTFGMGRRVDDLATFVGHLVVLAETTPSPVIRDRIRSYARTALTAFDRTVDPSLLRAAIAAVVLGLATGPFRVLEPRWRAGTAQRIELAEAWLTSAETARGQRERPLTADSRAPQRPARH